MKTLLLASALALLAATAAPARADLLVPSTTADAPPPWHCPAIDARPCTLRAAVGQNDDDGGGDLIQLLPGHYQVSNTIDVLSPVVIAGTGTPDQVVLDATGNGNPALLIRPKSGGARLAHLTVTGAATAILATRAQPLEIDDSIVSGNSTSRKEFGGGLLLDGGSAVIDHSVFADNSAGSGGAIAVLPGADGLTIRDSELRGNHTIAAAGEGGALFAGAGSVDIADTLIDGNEAAGEGGAVFVNALSQSTLALSSDTFAGNAAPRAGALGGDLARVTLVDSVLAGGGGAQCATAREAISLGHNLADDRSCGLSAPADREATDARLDPATFVPLADSPLIDAADPALCEGADLRGVARPQGGGCDIGALERPADPPASGDTPPPSAPPSAPLPPTTPPAAGPHPPRPAPALRVSRLHVKLARTRVRIAWTATVAGPTRFVLRHRAVTVARFALTSRRGGNHAYLPRSIVRRLRPGRYRLTAAGAATSFRTAPRSRKAR